MTFAANGITPRSAILVDSRGPAAMVVDEALRCLTAHHDQWDMATLTNMDASMPTVSSFPEQCRQCGLPVIGMRGRTSPFVSIAGDFDAYWTSRFNSKRRNTIRHSMKMLAERGRYHVVDYAAADAKAALDLAFQVSANSWKGRSGSHMTGTAAREAFYRDITASFSEKGQIRIWVAFLDSRPIATQYHLTCGKKLYCLVNDFDQAFEELSPGTILLFSILQRLYAEQQVECAGFGWEAYQYKMKWATGTSAHVSFNSSAADHIPGSCTWLGRACYPVSAVSKHSSGRHFPTRPQPMFDVEIVTEAFELARYREEWQALLGRGVECAVFDSYEWVTTWLESFWKDRPIAFLFVRDGRSLAGVLPLLSDSEGDLWCAHTLVGLLNGHSPWANVLYAEDLPALLDAALGHLAGEFGRFRLALPRVLAAGSLAGAFADGGPGAASTCPRNGSHAVAGPLDKRRLGCLPGIAIPTYGARDKTQDQATGKRRPCGTSCRHRHKRAGPDLDDIMQIEANSWKQDDGSSFTAAEQLVQFYGRFAVQAAENGWLRLYLLYLDGKPVAHVYGVVFRNHYYALKNYYHSAYRNLAPGIVLFDHALRDAFNSRLEAVHFLGEVSAWKQKLTHDVEHRLSVCLFTRGLPWCAWCDFYNYHLKGFVKGRFPGLVAVKRKVASFF